jgi:spore germination protein GerM
MSGNDNRKLKELADRLVAMSPEPPPFPEEVSVTQREESKPRPVLVFAGAALVVLLLAAIPIFLSRGGGEVDPIASSTTSTVPATVTTQPQASTTVTTEQPATTTTVPATTTSQVASEPRGVIVFFTQSPENSFTGNPALVALATTVYPSPEASDTLAALQMLTTDELFLPEGITNSIPAPVEVIGVTRGDQVVTVDMNEAFLEGAGGLLADMTMLNQLIYTAGEGVEIAEVLFTVDGQPVTTYGSEGLDLSQPVGRDAFLDQLNSVNVDAPVWGMEGDPLAVTGFANVFEATVSLQLVDEAGNVVHEDFTTATCGTGCWGAFRFETELPDFDTTPPTARVFWHSAEDGTPTDVVSVPILWGDDFLWPDYVSHPGTP